EAIQNLVRESNIPYLYFSIGRAIKLSEGDSDGKAQRWPHCSAHRSSVGEDRATSASPPSATTRWSALDFESRRVRGDSLAPSYGRPMARPSRCVPQRVDLLASTE